MKLYYSKGACSLAVRIILHEMGLPCTFEAVDLKTKRTETGEDFYKINAKGAVPALLLDNKVVLTENMAIQQYLADQHQATSLLPAVTDFQRYRVLEWLNFISTDLHKGCALLFNAQIPADIKESIFKPLLKQKLQYVSQQLGQSSYLCGTHFTLADGYLFVVLSWLPVVQFKITDWPTLSNYFDSLKKRPAIERAMAEEGL